MGRGPAAAGHARRRGGHRPGPGGLGLERVAKLAGGEGGRGALGGGGARVAADRGRGTGAARQETFPSKEERTKAALAALEKVHAEHGRTTAGATALAETGFLKLKSGDAAGAQKDLSDFLGAAAKDHPLRPFAQESLGYAFEAAGKLDEARAGFEKLREMDMPARADYHAARLALMQNKPDAKQQLERITKEYPKETEVVRAANERLELASLPPAGAAAPAPAPAGAPAAPGKKK